MSRRPERVVPAWSLAEGDILPGGILVVSVQRDAAAGRVVLGSHDGGQRILYREDRLGVTDLSGQVDQPPATRRLVGSLLSSALHSTLTRLSAVGARGSARRGRSTRR